MEKLKVANFNFDIIFIDPPYKEIKIDLIIEEIHKKKLIKKGGIIIIHRHKKDVVNISDKITVIEQRVYGISKIIFGFLFFFKKLFVSLLISSTSG